MKKERVVVLCICAIVLGSLYAQGIAWACHFAMPSMAQIFWPIPLGMPFGGINEARQVCTLSDSIGAFVCSAWPPLGFLYSEARVLRHELGAMHTLNTHFQESDTPGVVKQLKEMTSNPSTAVMQER